MKRIFGLLVVVVVAISLTGCKGIKRQETKLGWISIFRIRRECRKAEYIRNICALNDPKHIYSAD